MLFLREESIFRAQKPCVRVNFYSVHVNFYFMRVNFYFVSVNFYFVCVNFYCARGKFCIDRAVWRSKCTKTKLHIYIHTVARVSLHTFRHEKKKSNPFARKNILFPRAKSIFRARKVADRVTCTTIYFCLIL